MNVYAILRVAGDNEAGRNSDETRTSSLASVDHAMKLVSVEASVANRSLLYFVLNRIVLNHLVSWLFLLFSYL